MSDQNYEPFGEEWKNELNGGDEMMNIQDMKKRLPELELLERQRDNGAVIEGYESSCDEWYTRPLGDLCSNAVYRIKQSPRTRRICVVRV